VLLSIVTINLNNLGGLTRTLKSLVPLAVQREIQLIGIDGGSIDGSADVVREFYRTHTYEIGCDNGIYDAMNKGLNLSLGKFVFWLNSGDDLLLTGFESMLSVLQESDADIVTGAVVVKKQDTQETNYIHFPKKEDIPSRTFPHQATFFRRETLVKHKGYDCRYRILADRELILRICKAEPLVIITNIPVANYYEGGISASVSAGNESLLVDLRHGLISRWQYVLRMRRRVGNRQLLCFAPSALITTRDCHRVTAKFRYTVVN
jgi:glycosyltransferase involved in cell wall biosynthesis